MTTSYTVPDNPKMLRETLATAQMTLSVLPTARWREHTDRIQRLIDECDRHRPLDKSGKHGDKHTDTCGCEDK